MSVTCTSRDQQLWYLSRYLFEHTRIPCTQVQIDPSSHPILSAPTPVVWYDSVISPFSTPLYLVRSRPPPRQLRFLLQKHRNPAERDEDERDVKVWLNLRRSVRGKLVVFVGGLESPHVLSSNKKGRTMHRSYQSSLWQIELESPWD